MRLLTVFISHLSMAKTFARQQNATKRDKRHTYTTHTHTHTLIGYTLQVVNRLINCQRNPIENYICFTRVEFRKCTAFYI